MADTAFIDYEKLQLMIAGECIKCHEEAAKYDGVYPDCNECPLNSLRDGVRYFKRTDVAPVVHGKWEWEMADNGWANHICSECGWTKNTDIHVYLDYNYCPNCGSDMREAEGEDGNIATDNGCATCDLVWSGDDMVGYKKKQMTNADRIRAMTDEELAVFLAKWEEKDIDYSKTFCNMCKGQYDCDDCRLEWLKKEVQE